MTVAERPLSRGQLRNEVLLVFGVSLGASAIGALLNLVNDLLVTRNLASVSASLVSSYVANHWLDLVYQLVHVFLAVVPALLALHLLGRTDQGAATIGLDVTQPARDAGWGAVIAAVIGGAGLGLYLAAHALGLSVTLAAVNLPAVWWRVPVLLLSALHDGVLEEIVVLGYLLHRLRQLGWGDNSALAVSALIRGAYHLYQGFGGFLGNAVMGVIFGRIYQRYGRVTPLLLAHFFIDAVAFVGYVELAGKVSWLPT
jgi:membrane protease YdiL (CAAX protease family)